MGPEQKVKRKIRQYLNSLGPDVYFVRYGIYGTPGYPDLVGVVRGYYVGIEVKAPEKRGHEDGGMSPVQKATRRIIEIAGGIYILAYGVDEVRPVIEKILEESND